jgi:hypothetical protein
MTRYRENTRRWIGLLAMITLSSGAVSVAQSPAPGLGTWKLNVAKSKFSPGPAPKSSSVTFSAAGQGVKAVIDGISGDGAKVHWEYSANFDGKPYPVTGNPNGDMVVAKRVDATTVETSYTLKGKPTTLNRRVVAADGKTLTVTTTGVNAQGQKVNDVQVFEKG